MQTTFTKPLMAKGLTVATKFVDRNKIIFLSINEQQRKQKTFYIGENDALLHTCIKKLIFDMDCVLNLTHHF